MTVKRKQQTRLNRAMCPSCGRDIATLVPRGGDGSQNVFRRHKDQYGRRCDMSRSIVPAPKD